MSVLGRLVSLDEAAALTGVGVQQLLHEMEAGTNPAYTTVEGLLSRQANLSLGSAPPASPVLPVSPAAIPLGGPATATRGCVRLELGGWNKIPTFPHRWPDRTVETYADAYEASAKVNGRSRVIVIGFTQRASAGMADRARAVVFFQSPPKERALVEFSGDGNLQTTTRYASPIKPRGEHTHLGGADPVPPEYQSMRRERFSKIVRGPYASHSIAVVADSGDFDTMAWHGVIRGVYKGWL